MDKKLRMAIARKIFSLILIHLKYFSNNKLINVKILIKMLEIN